MRKVLVSLLILSVALFLFACSPATLSESEIYEDVENLIDFQSLNIEPADQSIIKRQTNVQEGTDIVYVSISGENADYSAVRNYKLVYLLYNDGWLLEEYELYEDENHINTIKPLHGVDPEMLAEDALYFECAMWSDAVLETSVMDAELVYSDLENFSEEYQFYAIHDYPYFTETVLVDVYYEFYDMQWIPYFTVVSRDVSYKESIIGTWRAEFSGSGSSAYRSTFTVEFYIYDISDDAGAVYTAYDYVEVANSKVQKHSYSEPKWETIKYDPNYSGYVVTEAWWVIPLLITGEGLSYQGYLCEKVA